MGSKSRAAILLLMHHLHLGSFCLSEGITCLNAQHMNSAGPHIQNIKPQLLHLCINISCQERGYGQEDCMTILNTDLDHQNSMGTEPFHKKAFLFSLQASKPLSRVKGTAKHKVPAHCSPIPISPRQRITVMQRNVHK